MTCQLLSGSFSYAMQGLLGVLSLSVLLLKYMRERKHGQEEARTWFTFCLDSSKQVIGALWVHAMNIIFSVVISTVSEKANECEWYWINVVVDGTFGVGVNFFCLWLLHTLVSDAWVPCCQQTDRNNYIRDLLNGVYTIHEESLRPSISRNSLHELHRSVVTASIRADSESRFDCKKFLLQVLLWVLIVTAMKFVVAGFTWAGAEWMLLLADYILQKTKGDPNLELIVVMIFTPTIMNMFQFWMTDDFIKFDPRRQIDRRGELHLNQRAHHPSGCAAWLPWFWWMLPIFVAFLFNSPFGFIDVDGACAHDHRTGEFVVYDVIFSLVRSAYFVVLCIRICPFHPGIFACWGLGMPPWLCGVFMVALTNMIFLLMVLPVNAFAFGSWGTFVIAGPFWLGYSLGFFVKQLEDAIGTEAETEDISNSRLPRKRGLDNIDRMKHTLEMINGIHESDFVDVQSGSALSLFSSIDDPPTQVSSQEQAHQITEPMQLSLRVRPKRWLLWLFLGCFMFLDISLFGLVFTLVRIFRDHIYINTTVQNYFVFIGILLVCKIYKVCLKTMGFMCDVERASGSFDALFTGAVIGTLATNFYYRLVFLYVTGWQIFAMLQIFQICGIWLEFVLPASKWYLTHIIERNWGRCIGSILQRTSFGKQRNVQAKDWQCLMAVLMSLHLYGVVFSILVFAFASTVIKFGVNSRYWSSSCIYSELMLKLLIQLITELLNAGLIELWYRKRLQIRSPKRMSRLLEDKQFRILLITAGTCWSLAVWVIGLPKAFCTP